MANFTIKNTRFPDGTVVGAYVATPYTTFPANGRPPGTAVKTATASGREVIFSGLEYGTRYFAAAEVNGSFIHYAFLTETASEPEARESDAADIAVIKEGPINVEYPEYGADGTRGTDSTAAFQAAITALPPEGGEIDALNRFQVDGQLNCEGKRSIKIKGQVGIGRGLDPRSQILFTQGGSSPLINAKKTDGFILEDIELQYSNAGFTGTMIDLTEAFHPDLFRVHLNASGLETALGVDLRKVESATLTKVQFGGGVGTGLRGKLENSDHSNVVHLRNCIFKEAKTIHAKNAGESWKFESCIFEPLINGKAGAYTADEGVMAYGLTFDNCWFGDALAEGTQLTLRGKALNVRGGTLGSGALGIYVPDTASDALTVKGVRFISLTDAIRANWGSGTHHYDINPNGYEESVTGKKVSLDNGTTDLGAGIIQN